MAKASKQTSAAVSAIAARVLGDEGLLSPAVATAIGEAIDECGIPLNDRAKLVLVGKIETALAPLVEDAKALAASCLSQDETSSKKPEGFSEPVVSGDAAAE